MAERSLAVLSRRYRDLMDYLRARIEVEEQTARSSLDAVSSRVTDPTSCVAPFLAALEREIEAVQARKGPLHDHENPYGVPASHRFLRGNALYRLGRRDEARAQFRQAVAADPAHANAWNNLLALHLEAKDPICSGPRRPASRSAPSCDRRSSRPPRALGRRPGPGYSVGRGSPCWRRKLSLSQ